MTKLRISHYGFFFHGDKEERSTGSVPPFFGQRNRQKINRMLQAIKSDGKRTVCQRQDMNQRYDGRCKFYPNPRASVCAI